MPEKNHFIPPPVIAALGPAYKALEEKNFLEALRLSTAYVSDTNAITRLEAAKVAAVAHFELGNFVAAGPLFKAVAQTEPTPRHWLSALTCFALENNPTEARAAFKQAEITCAQPHTEQWESDEPTFSYILYYYIQALCDTKQLDEAATELARLAALYLATNGEPSALPLPLLLEVAARVHRARSITAELPAWLDTLGASASAPDADTIAQYKAKLQK